MKVVEVGIGVASPAVPLPPKRGGMGCGLPGHGLIELELWLWLGAGRIPGRGLIEFGLPRWAARVGKGWRCGRLADMGKDRLT